MSVANLIVKQTYTGDGATTSFAITQDHKANSEIVVYLRDETSSVITQTLLALTTDYSFVGGDPATSITTVATYTSTQKVVIWRQMAKTQPLDLLNTAKLPAESLETEYDREVMQAQEAFELLKHAPVFDFSQQNMIDKKIPEPEISNVLGLNSTATEWQWYSPSELLTAASVTNNGYEAQVDNALPNNSAMADLGPTAITLDAAVNLSAEYMCEISRSSTTTNLFANGRVFLQRVNGVWRVQAGTFTGDVHGVTFGVSESGGIATLRASTTNESGTGYVGSIKLKKLPFTV